MNNSKVVKRVRAKRTQPNERKKQIVECAIYLAMKIGHLSITRAAISKDCGIGGSLIYKYFSSMDNLKKRVLKEAIKSEILPILAHCISNNRLKIPEELKRKTLDYLAR